MLNKVINTYKHIVKNYNIDKLVKSGPKKLSKKIV